jgi:hypothetical protein
MLRETVLYAAVTEGSGVSDTVEEIIRDVGCNVNSVTSRNFVDSYERFGDRYCLLWRSFIPLSLWHIPAELHDLTTQSTVVLRVTFIESYS